LNRWRIWHGLGLLVSGLVVLEELWRLVGLWAAALALHAGLWAVAWRLGRASSGRQKQEA